MRVRLALKATLIVALGVTSSVATSMVLSRARRAHAASARQRPVSGSRITEQGVNGPPAAVAPGRRNVVAGATMHLADATVQGNSVHIAAMGHIRDTQPNVVYLWGVRVLDLKDRHKVLFEKLYKDQIFSMPEQQERPVTFEDVIQVPLPRGTYLLDVAVYHVGPGQTLASLADPVSSQGSRVPVGLVEIDLNP
jgi:hypothetical protein